MTASFSHRSGFHLLGNMATLFFFGPTAFASLGARAFVGLYLGSGIASSSAHAATSADPRTPALGASGSINASVAYDILLNPLALIVVFAEFLPIPMPAALYGVLYIGRDCAAALGYTEVKLPFGLGQQFADLSVAHAAHVGGAACGLAAFVATRGRRGGP